jgi:hypothetical protein
MDETKGGLEIVSWVFHSLPIRLRLQRSRFTCGFVKTVLLIRGRPQRMGCEWMGPREAWKSFLGLFIRCAFACGLSEAALPAASAKPRYLRL